MTRKALLRPEAGGDLKAGGGMRRSERLRKRKVVGVKLPLKLGSRAMCRGCDKKLHLVEVVARRKLSDQYEYYVHYTEFDRSFDEWVKLERLNFDLEKIDNDQKVKKESKSLKIMTRLQRKKNDMTHVEKDHEDFEPGSLQDHKKVKNIAKIELGRFEMETWYFSPFPPEYNGCEKLYFCEFCLNYMKRKEQLLRHMKKCELKHPPGNEIYRSGTLSIFEVDGMKNKVYSQNLCSISKLFIEHKAADIEVGGFLFYILCECDDRGCHIVAYFSKEKHSMDSCNLSCILTFPPYQKKGYGKFLIAFSYELSKIEGKAGTPERPLTDLGSLSYKRYWARVILGILKRKGDITINELSNMTAIKPFDIYNTLQELELVKYENGQYFIPTNREVLDLHLKAAGSPGLPVDVSKLIWTPYGA